MNKIGSKYTKRFLARVIIVAETPLAVGSGEKDITTDSLVALDVNGLPYIPGTAVCGVVRSMLKQNKIETDALFGFQRKEKGKGSEIIFTEAKILDSNGDVVDGLDIKRIKNDNLLKEYAELPIRQHVRINARGVSEKGGKFDEQVVFAGTRFCFEIEMLAESSSTIESMNNVLSCLTDETFRLGGGTRKGFGKIKVIELKTKSLDLTNKDEMALYLSKSSSLKATPFWNNGSNQSTAANNASGWVKYNISLVPENFFLFGSGFGDDEADVIPVKESKVVWENGSSKLVSGLILIPATSVKGAIAHRVAFHWNKIKGIYAGSEKAKENAENEAVKALFGCETNKEHKRGNVLFSDVILKPVPDQILNHVSIDRFTGGAKDGALFTEKVSYGKNCKVVIELLVSKNVLEDDDVKLALENTLDDLSNGMLPLGGGVNRGNGIFTGSWTKTE